MFTLKIARSMAEAKGLPSSAIACPSSRMESHFFGLRGEAPREGHMLIDARGLSSEELRLLRSYKAPVIVKETRRSSDGLVLSHQSPYRTYPQTPRSRDGHFYTELVEIFHFHDGWDWTIPASVIDVRPTEITREEAIDLYCEKIAGNNHASLIFRGSIQA